MITSKESIEKYGVEISNNITFEDFKDSILKYCEENKTKQDYWPCYEMDEPLCALLYPYNGPEIIDYEQNEVYIDSKDFKKTMELYKSMHEIVYKKIAKQ